MGFVRWFGRGDRSSWRRRMRTGLVLAEAAGHGSGWVCQRDCICAQAAFSTSCTFLRLNHRSPPKKTESGGAGSKLPSFCTLSQSQST